MEQGSTYIARFEAAQDWTRRHVDRAWFPDMRVDSSCQVDISGLTDALALDFQEFMENTAGLAGRCFQVVREVSYVLMDLRLGHEVTIGDVLLPDGPYVSLSRQRLKRDLRAGYRIDCDENGYPVGVPAHAHAWITLQDGQVIDATVLSSMNRRAGLEPLSFQDIIYHDRHPANIHHLPLMTGFGYHGEVLTHPLDRYFDIYRSWFVDHSDFMARIAT